MMKDCKFLLNRILFRNGIRIRAAIILRRKPKRKVEFKVIRFHFENSFVLDKFQPYNIEQNPE